MKGRIRWKQIGPAREISSADLPSASAGTLADWRRRQERARAGLRLAGMLAVLGIGLGVLAVLIVAIWRASAR
jgi:hypothetical protein